MLKNVNFSRKCISKRKKGLLLIFLSAVAKFPENLPCILHVVTNSASIYTKDFLGLKLKAQSCRSYDNKYIITSTQITNTELFVFIAILVFKLLSR